VKGITLEHIKEYFKTFVSPQKSQLIVAGACETADMKGQWEKLFESWGTRADLPSEPEKKQPVLTENRIRIIDKPEYSQTTLIIGHPGIHELHEQKVTLAVANFIFGGGNFSSRLMKRMRTETGRTYSIASALNSHKEYGVFTIATSTQNNQLESVINSVFDTYNNFVDNGATESEIEKAKQFAAGNMAFELEGLNNIVEKLLWLRFFGRDNSFIESYEKLFLPVNTTSIKEALQKDFSYKHFVIIAVGKKIEIEKQVEKFGSVRSFHYQANPLVD
jgi:DNA-directed RNA polymerase